jgi:hypothetical protein
MFFCLHLAHGTPLSQAVFAPAQFAHAIGGRPDMALGPPADESPGAFSM